MSFVEQQPAWFCVLPDENLPRAARQSLVVRGHVLARHATGRPWIVGRGYRENPSGHQSNDLRLSSCGPFRVAVAGFCPISAKELQRAVDQAAKDGHHDRLARLPGSYYLILSEGGKTQAYGDAAGLARLFYAKFADKVIAGNRAGVLAELVGSEIDERWLAARLLAPEMPATLRCSMLSPFRGVTPVPPGHRIQLGGAAVTVERYWSPPEPTLHLAEGAERLSVALTDAVAIRASSAPKVSVQLSGGLDSTALAALTSLARPTGDTLLLTVASATPDNPDARWAQRCATRLAGVEHRVLHASRYPSLFDDMAETAITLDEPISFAVSCARVRHTATVIAGYGSGAHLNGQGGDEVLLAPLAYLSGLWRNPRVGIRHLRGYAALHGIAALSLLASIAVSTRGVSHRPGRWRPDGQPPTLLGWEARAQMPPWATPEAVNQVLAVTRSVPRPSGDRLTHATLALINASARRSGLYQEALTRLGVASHFPYFDQSVIEACLGTRPEERTTPYRPKPLLATALHPAAPDLLTRRDKGHHNHDLLHGLKKNRDAVLDLFGPGCALAQAGLIDPAALHHAVDSVGPDGIVGNVPLAFLTETIALELWLRTFKGEGAHVLASGA
ncbi:asparagine synthase-related protein [Nonomuraea sp. NPDC050404]|uniref:asparagine synthase-related protein n=1 Tax=Nonomuraea sp. NPDC050404 TaxID=3155783 RepID=UPI003408755F